MQSWPLASPLLSDPVRGVRLRAVALLASPLPISLERSRTFDRAAAEFIEAQRFNADRPGSSRHARKFFAQRGRAADAETEHKAALRLEPQYATAAINSPIFIASLARCRR